MSERKKKVTAAVKDDSDGSSCSLGAASASRRPPVVKKELPDTDEADIQEFAETAMNELLGWYGYAGPATRDDSSKTTPTSATATKNLVVAVADNSPRSFRRSNRNRCASDNGTNNGSDRETTSPKRLVPPDGCEWCGNAVEESKGLSSSGSTFCSELCFSNSRRANFKKNKTCDWCRHVRHTVSYVDFQEGACQLQFCSDKCLNQYKMHIFCRETRAHLEMHPHLPGEDTTASSSSLGGALITPDLWMRNCKSPSDRGGSLSPPGSASPPPVVSSLATPSLDGRPVAGAPVSSGSSSPPPPPLIRLAHPSKYMSPSLEDVQQQRPNAPAKRQQKTPRKRQRAVAGKKPTVSVKTAVFLDSPESSPQDLRVHASLNTPPLNHVPSPHHYDPFVNSSLFPYHSIFGGDHPLLHDRHFAPPPPLRRPLPPPPPPPPLLPLPKQSEKTNPPGEGGRGSGDGLLPPVTMLVPYPIVVPLPLPIPIPVPLTSDGKIDGKSLQDFFRMQKVNEAVPRCGQNCKKSSPAATNENGRSLRRRKRVAAAAATATAGAEGDKKTAFNGASKTKKTVPV